MKLTIEGSSKEIAALVSELQERQEMTLDSIVKVLLYSKHGCLDGNICDFVKERR